MQRTLLLAGAVVLSGCAALIVDIPEHWPDDIPARTYYERVWEAAPEIHGLESREQYLGWVTRFYSGTFLVPGWKKRQAEIAAQLSPAEARLAEPDLALLGQLISSEWSKPDPLRRVNSKMLVLWGRVMTDARDQGRLIPALDAIRDDTRALLTGGREPSSITRDRYSLMTLTKENTR